MSSPPTHNVLTDPRAELTAALESHAFGVASFAITEVGTAPLRAVAEIVLLKDEGTAKVVLDSRGYTIEHTTTPLPKQHTFESLDALLIALSPAYGAAMQDELMKRFETPSASRWDYADDDGEEPAWID